MPNQDPYGAYNFSVVIEGIEVARFAEVTGLDFEVEVIEYRDGNDSDDTVRKIPGLRKYANLTLKRGVTGDGEFWNWIVDALQGSVTKRSVTVSILNEEHEPVASWGLDNAWPCKYRGPDLVATGNEVAIESVELCHEGLHLLDR